MTARERLIKTLNHEDPGKVVVDMGATSITGINANALDKLRRTLGLEERKIKINEPLQLLGLVEEDVREALHIDVVDITNNTTMYGFENKGWKPFVLQSGLEVEVPENFNTTVDAEGNTYLYAQGDMNYPPASKMPKDGFFFDHITRGNIEFDEDTDSAKEDFKDDFGILTDEHLRYIEDRCNYFYNNTGYGMIGGGALAGLGDFATIQGPNVKQPKGIRDIPDFMMAHMICPDYIHEVYEMQTEVALKNAKLFREACGDKIQAIVISGTDFGTQNGPFMSMDSFREFYKPCYTKINNWVHENTNWKTFYHSCGAISDFLQDFHEMGVDILNPVQLSANGMDGRMLKDKWGDKFTFWGGGVDTQKTLPFGTPEEVYDEVMQRLQLFSKDGGFVFNTVHNIQGQTSAENMMAMFQAIEDFNRTK
ncbi:MAG: uroporphyrinogen decarboxylase family protein [Lachnospiraceae bacterium]|nr:uroporphyrinogen decarboxylase family protein [Lachnospiraceae bacterium]